MSINTMKQRGRRMALSLNGCHLSAMLLVVLTALFLEITGATGLDFSLGCLSDSECKAKFGETSACLVDVDGTTGSCSNPFAAGGCLVNRLVGEEWARKRVCNSQDPQGAIEQGLCRESPLDYTEIRIQSQNWESAIVVTWMMQILLSELLDVPVSIETSDFLGSTLTNLYGQNARLDLMGWANNLDAMRLGQAHKDCVPLTTNPDKYQPCAHVISEAWGSNQWAPELINEGILEPTQAMGELGHEGWYIPLHTALTEPTLLHYSGLVGEENREKLASMFKRPITWVQYCDWISPSNCTVSDETAVAYPEQQDYWKFFVPGMFQGYFMATEKNNCTAIPNCTGSFIDFPCGWSSYFQPIAYHLNIPMESDGSDGFPKGYAYSQMKEIWRAANATRSHVMMLYTKPEAFYQEFVDTDYEFQRIALAEPSEKCLAARRPDPLRCAEGATFEERMGDSAGTCDEPEEALQRVIISALKDITSGDTIPDALHSPGYEAIGAFKIDNIQLDAVFDRWIHDYGREPHFGLREATCDWVVDNIDYLKSFVPRTYPRIVEQDEDMDAIYIVATALGALALACSLCASAATHAYRGKSSIKLAQIEFLWILLAGLVFMSLGGMLGSFPPTDALCVARAWLVNFGYTFELVPLLVKSVALNRVMSAGKRMRRVQIMKTSFLFRVMTTISIVLVATLVTWTIVDPPQRESIYALSGSLTSMDETIVTEWHRCASTSEGWWFASFAWQVFLMFAAAVLAFQNRNFREDIADTRTLAMMIYSHVLFLVLRTTTHILQHSTPNANLILYRSLLISIDTMCTILIYFVPKFTAKETDERDSSRISIFGSSLQFWPSNDQLQRNDLAGRPSPATPRHQIITLSGEASRRESAESNFSSETFDFEVPLNDSITDSSGGTHSETKHATDDDACPSSEELTTAESLNDA